MRRRVNTPGSWLLPAPAAPASQLSIRRTSRGMLRMLEDAMTPHARLQPVLLVLLALSLGACAGTPQRVPPTLGLRGLTVQHVYWNMTLCNVRLDVINGDAEPVTLSAADYALSVGDVCVATGHYRQPVTINPRETRELCLPVELHHLRIADLTRRHRALVSPAGELTAKFTGSVFANAGPLPWQIPFESAVSVPVTRAAWVERLSGTK